MRVFIFFTRREDGRRLRLTEWVSERKRIWAPLRLLGEKVGKRERCLCTHTHTFQVRVSEVRKKRRISDDEDDDDEAWKKGWPWDMNAGLKERSFFIPSSCNVSFIACFMPRKVKKPGLKSGISIPCWANNNNNREWASIWPNLFPRFY